MIPAIPAIPAIQAIQAIQAIEHVSVLPNRRRRFRVKVCPETRVGTIPQKD